MPAFEIDFHSAADRRRYEVDVGSVEDYESIFKYISLDSKRSWSFFEETLNESKLIGSTLRSLNDPFEGSCVVHDDICFETLEKICEYFDKGGDTRSCYNAYKDDEISEVARQVRRGLDAALKNARIISFCKRSDSPLLWSHYANSHKGACIQFLTGAFRGEKIYRGDIQYAPNRPVLPLSLVARLVLPGTDKLYKEYLIDLRRSLLSTLLFRKPSDWSYEQEFRVCYSSSAISNVEFDSSGFLSVIIGAKTSDDDIDRIKSIVRNSEKDIKLRRAKISEGTFAVDIVDL